MVKKKYSDSQEKRNLYLNSLSALDQLFSENEFFDAHDMVQVKYEMLRCVRVENIPIKEASKYFGFSRTAFYQIQSAFKQKGLNGLMPQKRGPKNRYKLQPEIIQFIQLKIEETPSIRINKLAYIVKEKFELDIHPRSIIRALNSHTKNEGEKK